MPGGQSSTLRGLSFTVLPADWYRRRLRFPFYFEQTNYAFDVQIKREAPMDSRDPWPNGQIFFAIRFENGDLERRPMRLPTLHVGETTTVHLDPVYVAQPGQTTIVIVINPNHREEEPLEFAGLYSYRVRTEESLWVSSAVGTFAALSLFAAIFVPICTAQLDKAPVVNNIHEIVIPTGTLPTATELTPTLPPESTPDSDEPQAG